MANTHNCQCEDKKLSVVVKYLFTFWVLVVCLYYQVRITVDKRIVKLCSVSIWKKAAKTTKARERAAQAQFQQQQMD